MIPWVRDNPDSLADNVVGCCGAKRQNAVGQPHTGWQPCFVPSFGSYPSHLVYTGEGHGVGFHKITAV